MKVKTKVCSHCGKNQYHLRKRCEFCGWRLSHVSGNPLTVQEREKL